MAPPIDALGMARASRDHASETLATKTDLREREPRIEAHIRTIQNWFASIMIAQGAAIVALIKLLP